ncbi:hypothetical protein WJX82_002150 [Trebouxia sp. C0006]
MESAVKALVSKRYPVTTLNLTYENGKKQTHFKFKDWQNATVDDCLEHFVDFRHNAVAIITNDVLVIDGDVLKQKEVQEVLPVALRKPTNPARCSANVAFDQSLNIQPGKKSPTLGHYAGHPLRFQQASLACRTTFLPSWRPPRSGHEQAHQRAFATSSNNTKEIAIVGGGLGGLMAARVLQKHGFNPVVFEREPSREAREQGGQLDLHPKSGQWAMEQAGLIDQFMAAARPEGQDMRVLDKDGSVLWEETDCKHMDRPEIGRPLLRQMLLDSLHQDTVRWDHQLTAIQPVSSGSGGCHMLKFKNGSSMAADIVIGADGGRSKGKGGWFCRPRHHF